MGTDSDYDAKLSELVQRAVVVGAGDLREVCILCQGADPAAVHRALGDKGLTDEGLSLSRHQARLKAARARRLASEVLAALPGANPDDFQWWFSLDSIERICYQVFLSTGAVRLVNIGTSTLAAYYQLRFDATCAALDVDEDVVSAIDRVVGSGAGRVYDVAMEPPTLDPSPEVAVLDPPWYESHTRRFLCRASQLVPIGARVFCTVPRELTRSGPCSEREQLASYARDAGLLVEDFYTGLVEYTMPDFERTAFRSFEKIQALPWRHADLACLRKTGDPVQTGAGEPVPRATRYCRGEMKKLRLFLHPDRIDPALKEPLLIDQAYSSTVSASRTNRNKVALWTSTNVAFRVRDPAVAARALQAWQDKKSRSDALATVQGDDSATLFLQSLYQHLDLPDDPDSAKRTPKQIAEHRRAALSIWAEPEPTTSDGDGYRNRFARDRDRVLWSNGLRQLANKTQVFSTRDSDHVRQRLTHSTEVMQLASTVGSSLGLDRDLIEAGALAHDIGHTPFGHAGEVTIDKSLQSMSEKLGFNHYEHGLDVVVWLEDAYRHPSNGEKFGLDLSPAVLECIFKHMFSFDKGRLNQKDLRRASKHMAILSEGPCHLEGQSVRAADKISYLISDIEDGLRLGPLCQRE